MQLFFIEICMLDHLFLFNLDYQNTYLKLNPLKTWKIIIVKAKILVSSIFLFKAPHSYLGIYYLRYLVELG